MNLFSHAPFVRILPAFIFGVICFFFLNINENVIILILFNSILLFTFWINSSPKLQYSYKYVSAMLLLTLFFCVGFILNSEKERTGIRGINELSKSSKQLVAEITSIPVRKGKSIRLEATICFLVDSSSHSPVSIKTYIYFGDTTALTLNIGDQIVCENKIASIPKPANPGQFDFRYYSSLKRIYFQIRLQSLEWKLIHRNLNFSILNFSHKLRDQLLGAYEKSGISGQENAVISALVLGDDSEIDRDLMTAFSASGTLHILSVSGMHVGIVFALLSFLLKRLEGKKGWWIVRIVMMMLIIWFYAIITGLSPSVIRSAMMFTFILLGRAINRNSTIYNTLAASILVICTLFDPLLLFAPGFQLSYLAVAGIAFLYKPIRNILYVRNKVGEWVWNLIAVSIAAQIATFPISLFYFHQFPNYFIPANLLIIPVSTAAIFGGIFLLCISSFTLIAQNIGFLLKWNLIFLNKLAYLIQSLPFSVTRELYLTISQCIILYLFLVTFCFYILKRSVRLLEMSIIILSIFILFKSYDCWMSAKTNQLIVYSNPIPAIELVVGKKSFLYYIKNDSAKAFKYSSDMHIGNRLKLEDRFPIEIDSTTLFNGKFLIFGKKYLQFSSLQNKKHILTFYDPDACRNFEMSFYNEKKLDKKSINLKSSAFIYDLNK